MTKRATTQLGRANFAAALFAVAIMVTAGARDAEAGDPVATPPESLSAAAQHYQDEVLPILTAHCFDCHGYGSAEGGLNLDSPPDEKFLGDRTLWWKVLKNLRAGVMPPAGSEPPDSDQQMVVANWIKSDVFEIDPENIDPGPASVRRLNRFEYGNTIRDLMGIDFNVEVLFPPDDSGFGFDNVGDAQTLSPMLVEKYLFAAKAIVDEAVPTVTRVLRYQQAGGRDFREVEGRRRGERMSVDDELVVSHTFDIPEAGEYRVTVDAMVNGSFGFHPRRATVIFSIDGGERSKNEYGWQERFKISDTFAEKFEPGEHTFAFAVEPVPLADDANGDDGEGFFREDTHAHYYINSVKVEGPLDPPQWQHPSNYQRFFTRDEPPTDPAERKVYATEMLRRFVGRAYRRPADEPTIERLTELAESVYQQPDNTFEAGVAHAMIAVLASPRFLLRVDQPLPADPHSDVHPELDEHSLASRLSYFFWSTMPDQELLDLADRGELRANLSAQVKRLLGDERSDAMIRAFVGQWLRARDVEHVSIDALAALGMKEEFEVMRDEFRRQFRGGRGGRRGGRRGRDRDRQDREEPEQTPEEAARQIAFRQRFTELRELGETFNADLRSSMRQETELMFEHILREDRSALELIDSDYTFLNERLARHYGIEGVRGGRMRKVSLPDDSPRGGVLTQGTMLTVTSNPTRTSPVKRGLYVLDNLLGTPPPPAPPGVPELEETADKFGDREPTLREVLEIHRESPLCNSCHARMDPIGLALENFNALGMWRDEEAGQPIDATGELVSGETFANVRALKAILKDSQRDNFYRCLTEKMLTYALGRGLDYHDVETVDQIVARLHESDGRMSVVLEGILHSAPFQRQRAAKVEVAEATSDPVSVQ